MKNNIQKIASKSLLLLFIVLTYSCNDDITERNNEFPKLNPTNTDATAGTWKPYLLTAPDEFAIDVPVATNTPAYTREINEIKSFQVNITDEQKRIIKYWSVGGVLRWNEIMRTLVARHNRPPYQNEGAG